jgi:TRAP-type uncharacterized transport system substrate-binding protein
MSSSEGRKTTAVRVAVVVGIALLLALAIRLVDFTPSWSYLNVSLLTGGEEGQYFALGKKLAERTAKRKGKLEVVSSAGTVDNLERLTAAKQGCKAQFALVQDGIAPPQGSDLKLVARLLRSESLFFLGKGASRFKTFADLRGARIGIGPDKSGTSALVRAVFDHSDLASLGVKLEHHATDEQLDLLGKGALELGAFVTDEDASMIRVAIVDRGLEVAALANVDVVARRHRYLWSGRIGAGQYDAVRMLPPEDRQLLRVDTLLVTNGCASRAQTVAMLSALDELMPGLIEHNRKKGESTFFPSDRTAKSFFTNQGPELADQHVPWLVDIMPPSNWVYVMMTVSVIFNLMGVGNRFRLWRIDVARVRLERELRDVLGQRLTNEELYDLEPEPQHDQTVAGRVEALHHELVALRDRCREQSLSMLVPMGQEMAYRYQEDQIEGLITGVRRFEGRLKQALRQEPADA